MAYENKPGNGAIFKNDRKESDKHPDYTGTFKGLDGVDYRVALWVKDGNKGKFFSMSQSEIKPKESKPEFDPFN